MVQLRARRINASQILELGSHAHSRPCTHVFRFVQKAKKKIGWVDGRFHQASNSLFLTRLSVDGKIPHQIPISLDFQSEVVLFAGRLLALVVSTTAVTAATIDLLRRTMVESMTDTDTVF